MQAIANNVYIEDQYPGVVLGAINLPHGIIQIDAPASPEDSRSWRASLLSLGGGAERVLINLDAHPDRTLGARAMECTTITHEKAAQVFRSRPSMFKGQGDDIGAEWELIPNLGNIRWIIPDITFSQQMTLQWGHSPIRLEYNPGPNTGAIWVILPEEKIVFIGDAVLKHQPPFFAHANIPIWIESLETLLSDDYRGYTVISGRGGSCANITIRNQLDYLVKTQKHLEKLAAKKSPAESTEKLIRDLLSDFRFPVGRQEKYEQRLRYGLRQYYSRIYYAANKNDEE